MAARATAAILYIAGANDDYMLTKHIIFIPRTPYTRQVLVFDYNITLYAAISNKQ